MIHVILLTEEEAAERLACSCAEVLALWQAGRIPGLRYGRSRFYDEADVLAFIALGERVVLPPPAPKPRPTEEELEAQRREITLANAQIRKEIDQERKRLKLLEAARKAAKQKRPKPPRPPFSASYLRSGPSGIWSFFWSNGGSTKRRSTKTTDRTEAERLMLVFDAERVRTKWRPAQRVNTRQRRT